MNTQIVTEARTWLGVPWQHQGRSREGVDCAGLAVMVAQAVYGTTFDIRDYPRIATDEQMIETCSSLLERIPARDIEPGDLVVFAYDRQRHMTIAADYALGGLSVIHAYAPSRKVVETRLDEKWRGRLLAAFRFPKEFA